MNCSLPINEGDMNEFQLMPQVPVLVTEDMIAGEFLKLTEKYRMSHAATDEVIELIKTVCDFMIMKALKAVEQTCEKHGLDTNSKLFQDLPGAFDSLQNPVESLGTIYKQQAYVSQNLPYVVSVPGHNIPEIA